MFRGTQNTDFALSSHCTMFPNCVLMFTLLKMFLLAFGESLGVGGKVNEAHEQNRNLS